MAIPANECSLVNITPAIASLGRETKGLLLLAITSAIQVVGDNKLPTANNDDSGQSPKSRERRCEDGKRSATKAF
jgi:hypothetical protein